MNRNFIVIILIAATAFGLLLILYINQNPTPTPTSNPNPTPAAFTSPAPNLSPSPALDTSPTPPQSTGSEAVVVPQAILTQTLTSPLTIEGQALGSWYFEGQFSVVLTDWDGLIIAQAQAQAQGDWMQEGYVPFTATLTFDPPGISSRGALIFQKANPSGLPQNADAVEYTVTLETE